MPYWTFHKTFRYLQKYYYNTGHNDVCSVVDSGLAGRWWRTEDWISKKVWMWDDEKEMNWFLWQRNVSLAGEKVAMEREVR